LNGQPAGIGFPLRLPDKWSGHFLLQGGGGMDGVINEVIGAIPVACSTARPVLNRG
jgi:hypothetical protein